MTVGAAHSACSGCACARAGILRAVADPAGAWRFSFQDLAVLRAVCKEGFTRDMADALLQDMRNAVAFFDGKAHHEKKTTGAGFHH